MQSDYEEAANVLKEGSRPVCQNQQFAWCSSMLPQLRQYSWMQSNYEEAANVLKKAQDQCIGIGDQLGAAQCSQSLGDILRMAVPTTRGCQCSEEGLKPSSSNPAISVVQLNATEA